MTDQGVTSPGFTIMAPAAPRPPPSIFLRFFAVTIKSSNAFGSRCFTVEFCSAAVVIPPSTELAFSTKSNEPFGEKFTKARKLLGNKKRSFKPCKQCDVAGDLIGQSNFDAFRNL